MAKKKTAKKKVSKKSAKKSVKKAAPKKLSKKVAKGAKKSANKAAPKKAAKKAAKKVVRKVVAKKKLAPKTPVALVEPLLTIGEIAPSFTIPNETGEPISLENFRGKKVVLYFYPKDDTPGCTQESCDFRDNFARVQDAGTAVFGISRDSVASHEKFKSKYSLPFSLLADEEGKVCEAYGVWKEKSMYGKHYMGIERTTFIIDETGRVAKIYPKVSVTGHVDQVLEDLK